MFSLANIGILSVADPTTPNQGAITKIPAAQANILLPIPNLGNMADKKELTHPQYKKDREVVTGLLNGEATDFNLIELARLRIRYDGFPGARDIQQDLDQALANWSLTEDELMAKTREIHQTEMLYKAQRTKKEDWS
ncbi:DUF3288 family protein [Leptothoe spongobia]|nr:DUF3288 family protein [Leptothoe spongobia]